MSDDMTVDLTKHHGLGNDFLIALDPPREVGSADAKRWCDRQTGIGADGLIVATSFPGHDDRSWTMTLWNADGGRAEISGNGIRCLGQAIGQRRERRSAVEPGTELLIDTDAGSRSLTLYPSGDDTWMVRAAMGPVAAGPAPSPAWIDTGLTPIRQQGVDVGNPHIVAIVDATQFHQADMAAVGPVIESGYPGGINVHVVHVADAQSLELKVWERGVGVTQACGSGACAAAWAANHHGLAGRNISVSMPGGSASVELTDDEAFLIGPATYVGSIRIA
jgi:diaminopimelate epimerase